MRGCQKRVVFLKNIGSDFFEEAYFVLKGNTDMAKYTDADIIREANRIIDENIGKRRRINIKKMIMRVALFASGAAVASVIALIL